MFFDSTREVQIHTGGDLPHWYQAGKIHYVTFRLADSLPASAREELAAADRSFRTLNPQPWDAQTTLRYKRFMGHSLDRALDTGCGSCLLRNPEIRRIVVDSLEYRNGTHYELDSYVVMPNHVHLLIRPISEQSLERIKKSIKGYSE